MTGRSFFTPPYSRRFLPGRSSRRRTPASALELRSIEQAAAEYRNPNEQLRRDVSRGPARYEPARAIRARRHGLYHDRRYPRGMVARRQRPSRAPTCSSRATIPTCARCCVGSSREWLSTCRSTPTPTLTRSTIASGSRSSSSTRLPIRRRWPGAIGRRPATHPSSHPIFRRCSTTCSRRCSASRTTRATRATRTKSSRRTAAATRSAIPG